jgi:molybdenum cofactor cytidylyltransferase
MSARLELAAIILAAGRSSRMGAFKPLLPFGSETVIECVLSACVAAGIRTIRVVVGWNAHRLIPLLEGRGVPWVKNERFTEGMYSSLQVGVGSLPAGVDAFFVLPGDMPLVRGETLRRLAAEWNPGSGQILYPCFNGKRGHPPLIAGSLIPEILRETPSGGLRELLALHAAEAREIACEDPGILLDLDTPEEYERRLPRVTGPA